MFVQVRQRRTVRGWFIRLHGLSGFVSQHKVATLIE